MEPSIVASAVAGIIHSLGVDITSLKPPPPDFTPAPYSSYISELDLTDNEIAIIPKETIAAWTENIFHTRQFFRTVVQKNSYASQLIDHLIKPAVAYELQKRKVITDFFYAQTDDVDRIALSQIGSTLRWGWRYIGSYLSHKLVEGAFIGHVNRENFDRATKFSFERMMHHTTKINALRGLAFHHKTLHFVGTKLPYIKEITQDQSRKQTLWRYRWITSENVRMLEVILTTQMEFYTRLMSQCPEEMQNDIRYKIILGHTKVSQILAELKASYFNHMIDIKPKSKIEAVCQKGINIATQFLSSLQAPPSIQSRDFLQVYAEALELTGQNYDQMPLFPTETTEFSIALTEFINAVSQDNFIWAKYVSLSSRTPQANFKWEKEAEKFEQYKRAIDKFIKIQNHLDDLITRLYRLCDSLFQNYLDQKSADTSYQKANSFIYELWALRNVVDELRIAYRAAYLKSLRTSVNESDVGYVERVLQSIAHKATRTVLRGELFDQTESQESAVDRGRAFTQHYKEKLIEIRKFIDSLSDTTLPAELLIPIDHSEDFFPVFYTVEGYRKLVKSIEPFTETGMDFLSYNIKRNCLVTPSAFWKAQLEDIEKYESVIQQFSLISHIAGKYLKLAPQLAGNLSAIKERADNIRKSLPLNFKKQAISDCNLEQPIDLNRVLSSGFNKIDRVVSTGQLIDSRKEFREIYGILLEAINNDAQQLAQLISSGDQPLTAHKIGTIFVFEPK